MASQSLEHALWNNHTMQTVMSDIFYARGRKKITSHKKLVYMMKHDMKFQDTRSNVLTSTLCAK